MDDRRDEKAVNRMNCLFWGSMLWQFVALVSVGIGMVARRTKHDWGIWFSVGGWIAFFCGFVIRSWVRSWFYRRNDKPKT